MRTQRWDLEKGEKEMLNYFAFVVKAGKCHFPILRLKLPQLVV